MNKKISIGPLSFDDGPAANEIVRIISDIFSPFSESLGFVGDKIRIFRRSNIEDVLKRVQSRVESEELKLTPPPARFLIPYMETVSMGVGEEESVLSEMWSELLISAGTEYKPSHLRHIRVLSELSAGEAKLLEDISRLKDINTDYEYMFFPQYGLREHLDVVTSIILEKWVKKDISRTSVMNKTADDLETMTTTCGIVPTSLKFNSDKRFAAFDYQYGKVVELINGLVASGLVDRHYIRVANGSQDIEATQIFVTPLGYDLMLAVTPEGARIKAAMNKWTWPETSN